MTTFLGLSWSWIHCWAILSSVLVFWEKKRKLPQSTFATCIMLIWCRIAPEWCSIPTDGGWEALCFTKDLQLMKHQRRQWGKSKSDSNWTLVGTHYKAYRVVMMVVKKKFLTDITASAKSHPEELFPIVHSGSSGEVVEVSVVHYGHLATFFASKSNRIR